MTKVCSRCKERYAVPHYSTDFVHKCNSGKVVLDQEDVLRVGDWTDSDGSTGKVGNSGLLGVNDGIRHTRADLEGASRLVKKSSRGKPVDLYRQRQHYQYNE